MITVEQMKCPVCHQLSCRGMGCDECPLDNSDDVKDVTCNDEGCECTVKDYQDHIKAIKDDFSFIENDLRAQISVLNGLVNELTLK